MFEIFIVVAFKVIFVKIFKILILLKFIPYITKNAYFSIFIKWCNFALIKNNKTFNNKTKEIIQKTSCKKDQATREQKGNFRGAYSRFRVEQILYVPVR